MSLSLYPALFARDRVRTHLRRGPPVTVRTREKRETVQLVA